MVLIIIYTGYSEHYNTNEAANLGIKRFLFKPIDTRTIALVVREVLDAAS
jgi:YesN/AraC family two-component response regulator